MTPETKIKQSICQYLQHRRDVFFWTQESIGQWDAKKSLFRKKRSKYQKNGIPDLLCMVKVYTLPPIFVGLEVKTPKGKQTDSQKKFEQEYKQFGGLYYVVKSAQDAHEAIESAVKYIKGSIPVTSN